MRILGVSEKWDKLRQPRWTTFRFSRRDTDWRVGEIVQVWFRPRSKKKRRFLGTAKIIEKVSRFMMDLTEGEVREDGFDNLDAMLAWLRKRYDGRIYTHPMNKLTLAWVKVNCVRCGRDLQLEEHHIIERCKGGNDAPDNKEYRCEPCHKFEHTKRGILVSLERAKKQGQPERVVVLEHRLEVLERLNTVELIQERGTYISYWEDETTHYFPPYKPKDRAKKPEAQQAAQLQGMLEL